MKNSEEIKVIFVIVKKWFDKISGNTYHSVRVFVNERNIGYEPFKYGYGDHYKQTALELLQKEGYFNTGEKLENGYSKDYDVWSQYQKDHYDTVLFDVIDVYRRRDL